MLSQMQEEINLIQMTELHVSDWIYTQEERMGNIGVAGVRPGGSEPVKPALGFGGGSSGDLSQLVQSAEDSTQKLNSISDTQANLLRELRSLQTIVNGLSRPGSMPITPQAIGSSGGGGGSGNGEVAQQVKAATDSVQALQKRLDDQLQQLKTDVGRVQTSVNNVAGGGGGASAGGGGGDGGMGWIPYLMLSFTTFCVASLTYHTFTQHMKNQRYKMI